MYTQSGNVTTMYHILRDRMSFIMLSEDWQLFAGRHKVQWPWIYLIEIYPKSISHLLPAALLWVAVLLPGVWILVSFCISYLLIISSNRISIFIYLKIIHLFFFLLLIKLKGFWLEYLLELGAWHYFCPHDLSSQLHLWEEEMQTMMWIYSIINLSLRLPKIVSLNHCLWSHLKRALSWSDGGSSMFDSLTKQLLTSFSLNHVKVFLSVHLDKLSYWSAIPSCGFAVNKLQINEMHLRCLGVSAQTVFILFKPNKTRQVYITLWN